MSWILWNWNRAMLNGEVDRIAPKNRSDSFSAFNVQLVRIENICKVIDNDLFFHATRAKLVPAINCKVSINCSCEWCDASHATVGWGVRDVSFFPCMWITLWKWRTFHNITTVAARGLIGAVTIQVWTLDFGPCMTHRRTVFSIAISSRDSRICYLMAQHNVVLLCHSASCCPYSTLFGKNTQVKMPAPVSKNGSYFCEAQI